ncbi:HECT-domain-containing protein [Pseudocohnilembus persalinus]|uniref:HECT-type E3 ubiquitin transferase n=1 Tax=Pseudocohnilembus persalinus TaxID=266149 RepID=A0A0V0R8P0_PSEPJ|nr:HECT-domain-containing protein [Pseudocohnilembus persalinus]|eukprot:KRX10841.1 HECT-domain-containing protein [Pseudocohnilembus persalinus]
MENLGNIFGNILAKIYEKNNEFVRKDIDYCEIRKNQVDVRIISDLVDLQIQNSFIFNDQEILSNLEIRVKFLIQDQLNAVEKYPLIWQYLFEREFLEFYYDNIVYFGDRISQLFVGFMQQNQEISYKIFQILVEKAKQSYSFMFQNIKEFEKFQLIMKEIKYFNSKDISVNYLLFENLQDFVKKVENQEQLLYLCHKTVLLEILIQIFNLIFGYNLQHDEFYDQNILNFFVIQEGENKIDIEKILAQQKEERQKIINENILSKDKEITFGKAIISDSKKQEQIGEEGKILQLYDEITNYINQGNQLQKLNSKTNYQNTERDKLGYLCQASLQNFEYENNFFQKCEGNLEINQSFEKINQYVFFGKILKFIRYFQKYLGESSDMSQLEFGNLKIQKIDILQYMFEKRRENMIQNSIQIQELKVDLEIGCFIVRIKVLNDQLYDNLVNLELLKEMEENDQENKILKSLILVQLSHLKNPVQDKRELTIKIQFDQMKNQDNQNEGNNTLNQSNQDIEELEDLGGLFDIDNNEDFYQDEKIEEKEEKIEEKKQEENEEEKQQQKEQEEQEQKVFQEQIKKELCSYLEKGNGNGYKLRFNFKNIGLKEFELGDIIKEISGTQEKQENQKTMQQKCPKQLIDCQEYLNRNCLYCDQKMKIMENFSAFVHFLQIDLEEQKQLKYIYCQNCLVNDCQLLSKDRFAYCECCLDKNNDAEIICKDCCIKLEKDFIDQKKDESKLQKKNEQKQEKEEEGEEKLEKNSQNSENQEISEQEQDEDEESASCLSYNAYNFEESSISEEEEDEDDEEQNEDYYDIEDAGFFSDLNEILELEDNDSYNNLSVMKRIKVVEQKWAIKKAMDFKTKLEITLQLEKIATGEYTGSNEDRKLGKLNKLIRQMEKRIHQMSRYQKALFLSNLEKNFVSQLPKQFKKINSQLQQFIFEQKGENNLKDIVQIKQGDIQESDLEQDENDKKEQQQDENNDSDNNNSEKGVDYENQEQQQQESDEDGDENEDSENIDIENQYVQQEEDDKIYYYIYPSDYVQNQSDYGLSDNDNDEEIEEKEEEEEKQQEEKKDENQMEVSKKQKEDSNVNEEKNEQKISKLEEIRRLKVNPWRVKNIIKQGILTDLNQKQNKEQKLKSKLVKKEQKQKIQEIKENYQKVEKEKRNFEKVKNANVEVKLLGQKDEEIDEQNRQKNMQRYLDLPLFDDEFIFKILGIFNINGQLYNSFSEISELVTKFFKVLELSPYNFSRISLGMLEILGRDTNFQKNGKFLFDSEFFNNGLINVKESQIQKKKAFFNYKTDKLTSNLLMVRNMIDYLQKKDNYTRQFLNLYNFYLQHQIQNQNEEFKIIYGNKVHMKRRTKEKGCDLVIKDENNYKEYKYQNNLFFPQLQSKFSEQIRQNQFSYEERLRNGQIIGFYGFYILQKGVDSVIESQNKLQQIFIQFKLKKLKPIFDQNNKFWTQLNQSLIDDFYKQVYEIDCIVQNQKGYLIPYKYVNKVGFLAGPLKIVHYVDYLDRKVKKSIKQLKITVLSILGRNNDLFQMVDLFNFYANNQIKTFGASLQEQLNLMNKFIKQCDFYGGAKTAFEINGDEYDVGNHIIEAFDSIVDVSSYSIDKSFLSITKQFTKDVEIFYMYQFSDKFVYDTFKQLYDIDQYEALLWLKCTYTDFRNQINKKLEKDILVEKERQKQDKNREMEKLKIKEKEKESSQKQKEDSQEKEKVDVDVEEEEMQEKKSENLNKKQSSTNLNSQNEKINEQQIFQQNGEIQQQQNIQSDDDMDELEQFLKQQEPKLSKMFTKEPESDKNDNKTLENQIENQNQNHDQKHQQQQQQLQQNNYDKKTNLIIQKHTMNLKKLVHIIFKEFIDLLDEIMDDAYDKSYWFQVIRKYIDEIDKNKIKPKFFLQSIVQRYAQNQKKQEGYYDVQIQVDRNAVLTSSLASLIKYYPRTIIDKQIDVKFEREEGIDAGGPRREWINLMLKEAFDPKYGLFKVSANKITVQPSPLSKIIPNYQMIFRILGRLIGKILHDGMEVEVSLTKSFLKHILKKDLYISDLEDIDPEQYNNLNWMLQNSVDGLDMNFTTYVDELGVIKTIELVENGSEIEVTEENKKEYVKAVAHYIMTDSIKEQTEAFIKGLYDIIPFEALQQLSESQLGLQLAGLQEIDLPHGGFQGYELEFSQEGKTDSLPVSHTCSRSLDLPNYDSREVLKQKLEMAIFEGAKGFYIG